MHNEFTKEELRELMNGIWCASKVHKITINHRLYGKIQAMIDNYCEHINTIDDSNMFTACQDCHAIW